MSLYFPDNQSHTRRLCWAMLALGAAVRLPGLFHDFWLDEVWLLSLLSSIDSVFGVFTQIHFDTNHWLQSILMYAVGDVEHFAVHRIAPYLAGIAAIWVAAFRLRYENDIEQRIVALLFSGSFLLTVYSAEARGYAFVVLFSLLAYIAMGRCIESPGWPRAVAFWAAAILGFLSHLTFVIVYAGLGLWSLIGILRRESFWRDAGVELFRCHLVPTLFLAWLYWIDIRLIQHGGSTASTLRETTLTTIGWATGAPVGGWPAVLSSVIFVGIMLAGIWTSQQEQRVDWPFFALVIFVAPAVLTMATRGSFTYWTPRHFIVCVPFILLLLARFLTLCYSVGRAGHVACAIALCLYVGGNAARTARFIQQGRGDYRGTMEFMAAHSPTPHFTVGSDHDFRNGTMLRFYRRRVPAASQLEYVARDGWQGRGPDWFLIHRFDPDETPKDILENPSSGRRFERVHSAPHSGISGWTWHLYKNTTP